VTRGGGHPPPILSNKEKMMKKVILTIMATLAISGVWAAPTVSIEDNAQYVLDARSFIASRSFATATQDFYLSVGANPIRLTVSVSANTTGNAYATIDWYETVSVTASTGTLMTAFNMNRRASTPTAVAKVSYSPSARTTTGVTTITMPQFVTGIGASEERSFHAMSPKHESGWVLKPNTKYFITVTPSSTFTNTNVKFMWDENLYQ
jgi:hypothetical protein